MRHKDIPDTAAASGLSTDDIAQPRERPTLTYPHPQADPGYGYQNGYPNPQAAGDRYYLRLIKHTGALILWHQQSYAVSGTLRECEAAYR